MECKAILKNIYQNVVDDCYEVVFQMQEPPTKLMDKISGLFRLKITKWSDKRTNQANRYFWELVNKLAIVQDISDADVHDKLLSENRYYVYNDDGAIDWIVTSKKPSRYGILSQYDRTGNPVYFIDSGMRVKIQREDGTYCENKDGVITKTIFWQIKGTHSMTAKEFSRVVDSLIAECKENDIETLPPYEIEQMKQAWGDKEET